MKRIKQIAWVLLIVPFLTNAQEYPIHIMEEGHIIVQVNLSESITGNFMLDTGAGVNVVSGKLFEKIKLTTKNAGYFTGFRHDGDRLDGKVYVIPHLKIGNAIQENPIVGVYPPLDDFGIDGLLSLKFFEEKPFTIDFVNKKLIFIDVTEVKQLQANNLVLPISIYQHTNVLLDLFIPVKLNDSITVMTEFDTGSGFHSFIVNPGYINDLNLNPETITTQKYTTQLSHEERVDSIYNLASISVGNGEKEIKLEDVTAIFREGMVYNALMGSGMFKDKKVTIDIPRKLFIVHN